MMNHPGLSRRALLAGLTAAATAAGLAACESQPSGGTSGGGAAGGPLVWWDQFLPYAALEKKTFGDWTAKGNPKVNYTTYNPNDQGKALQSAFQSKQMPDVFSLAGVGTQPSALLAANWFQPLPNADAITKAMPQGALTDGITTFDGKLYSFPIMSARGYDTFGWANKDLLTKAGIDPAPATPSWDQFRSNVSTAQSKTGKAGLLLPLGFPARMGAFAEQLAEVAGFPGMGGIEFATGAYHYDHEAYVNAIEWLLSFKTDKLLLPASSTLDARAGRARWAAGEAVYFLDGLYCAGVVKGSFAALLDKLAITQIPTPDGGPAVLTNAPPGGTFWLSASSKQPDKAGDLMSLLTTKAFRVGQVEAMDAPPLDLSVVSESSAIDAYKQGCEWVSKSGFLGPSAVARKPEVSNVLAAMKPVQPDLGTIVQGVLSGDVKDIGQALKQLSDGLTASRAAAIKTKGGGSITEADWAFPDWVRGKDYVAS